MLLRLTSTTFRLSASLCISPSPGLRLLACDFFEPLNEFLHALFIALKRAHLSTLLTQLGRDAAQHGSLLFLFGKQRLLLAPTLLFDRRQRIALSCGLCCEGFEPCHGLACLLDRLHALTGDLLEVMSVARQLVGVVARQEAPCSALAAFHVHTEHSLSQLGLETGQFGLEPCLLCLLSEQLLLKLGTPHRDIPQFALRSGNSAVCIGQFVGHFMMRLFSARDFILQGSDPGLQISQLTTPGVGRCRMGTR
ncbi:hypothetical protein [Uliginosibacterium paludis]|uniref:hypothetical protein n=1 Tax=Uliginosibacterium paludis TaxID=1615952 RepID=UPI0036D9BAAF